MRIRRSSFGGHLTAEPGAGEAELMLNDVNRFAGGEGHFGGSQTSEVVHFDDLREGGVLARQGFERLVHLEDFSPSGEESKNEASPPCHYETTAAAIARLDAQYPWLRGAESRFWSRSQ